MKLKKLFYAFFALVLIETIFQGCSNFLDEKESSQAEKGRLLFSVNSSARAASTINPTPIDFENYSGLTFTLEGTLNGTTSTLGTWNDSGDTKAYSLMSSDNSISVVLGDWTFRLSVTVGGNRDELLYGNLTKTIVQGNNMLDFGTLNEASKDDETGNSNIAGGSVSLTLSFPAGRVVRAGGSLRKIGETSTLVGGYLTITRGDENDSITFSADVNAGMYIVSIELYTTENGSSCCTIYTALVVVAPGAESKAERSIDLLNELYTVTYELNGGNFTEEETETITTSYSPTDKFTPPIPTKTGYTFAGWAKSSETTVADYAYDAEISISEDTTLYALWKPIVYTITYELNVDDLSTVTNSNVTTYTIEDNVTFLAPEYNTYGFYDWYESSDFSTGKIEGWNAGERTGDITLYAKIEGITEVTNENIVEKIKKMTETGILKASGEFSTSLIREINAALKELATSNSDVLVTLDLSDVTGLTELEEASTTNSSYSFFWCTNLKGIVLPDTITSIGIYAFSGCSSLEGIVLPDTITSIGIYAFSGCSSLEEMTIPFVGGSKTATADSDESIFGYIFGQRNYAGWTLTYRNSNSKYYVPSSLKKVTIRGGNILYRAFYACENLTDIIIGDGITSIEIDAFAYCKSLSNFTIPDGVTSIGKGAFRECTSLASITIPDGVTSIGYGAFRECTSLASITIPDGVTSIGEGAFSSCASIVVSDKNSVYDSRNNCNAIIETSTNTLICGCATTKIPDTVTSIGSSAFSNCVTLWSITIPESVTSIGNFAFYKCTGLGSITIPSSVISIGEYAFSDCTSLESVTISNGVKSIGTCAFYDCTNLESVTIGNEVEKIGRIAFQNCGKLTTVIFTDTSNWYYTSITNYTGGTLISATDLEDTSKSAEYLTSTYLQEYWYKE